VNAPKPAPWIKLGAILIKAGTGGEALGGEARWGKALGGEALGGEARWGKALGGEALGGKARFGAFRGGPSDSVEASLS